MKQSGVTRILFLAVLLIFCVFVFSPQSAFAASLDKADQYIPKEILVKPKPGKQLSQIRTLNGLKSLRVNQKLGVITIEVPQGADITTLMQQYNADPNVEYAEPNYIRHASYLPNDPELNKQWYIDKTRTQEAWEISAGESSVMIAIIDSGVDINHPDLAGKVVGRYNAADNSDNVTDTIGHGTHVAGIAAGALNNGTGIAGIGGNVSIMAVKASNTDVFYDDDIAEGIYWAVDHGARVINLSLGGEDFSNTLEDAVNYAINHNVVVIAAAGNDATNVPMYPAAFNGVIAVAATDSNDLPASFSNKGTYIDISAPGVGIYSTTPLSGTIDYNPSYDYSDGTSMAAPAVAGLAGLVLSYQPTLSQAQVADLIMQSAQDLGTPGWDESTGWGRIDAYTTLMNTSDTTPPSISTTTPDDTELKASISRNITVNFTEKISAGTNFSNITVQDETYHTVVPVDLSITNSTLTIDPVNFLNTNTVYTVSVPPGAVQDLRGNALAANYTFSFTTDSGMDFFELPFNVTDAVFDPAQPVVYITNKSEKRLYAVNYATGAISYLTFAKMPESLTVGQGVYADELYVALLDQEHSSYWWEEDQAGSIAIIDRNNFTQIDTIALTIDPYDIVAGRDGYLYIPSGSGQWTYMYSYSRATKQKEHQTSIRQQSLALLHPTLDRIYTVDTDSSPRDYTAFNIANGTFTDPLYPGGYDSPYHGDYPLAEKFSIDPTGTYLFNGSGVIFTSAADRSQDMRYVANLGAGFADIAYDSSRLYTLSLTNKQINIYDGSDFSLLDNYQLSGLGKYLYRNDGKLINLVQPDIQTALYKTGIEILNLSTTETNPPTVTSSDPVNNGEDIGVYRNLTINFNERIIAGPAYRQISLYDSENNLIPITTKINGRILTIDPIGNLAVNTQYTVDIPAGAVTDLAGSSMAADFSMVFTTISTINLLELPFTITDAVIDPEQPIVYITDKSKKQLYAVNYQTGALSAITFSKMPESLAVGEGAYADELYVALLDQEHSSYWLEENQTGSIAIIDRNAFAQTDTIALSTDPYDIVPGRDGYLYITSGSGQWTCFSSYNRATKQLVQQSNIRQGSLAKLHPILDRIYTVTTDTSPRDYTAFNTANGIFTDPLYPGGYDSSYHGDYPLSTKFAIAPTGNYLFNGSGVVFSSAADRSHDMKYVGNLEPYKDITFDQDSSTFYLISNNNFVNVYTSVNGSVYLHDYQMTDSLELWDAGKYLFKQNDKLFVLFERTSGTSAYQAGIQVLPLVERTVTFPDVQLESAVRDALHKPNGDIYKTELLDLTVLDASNHAIRNLTGLGEAANLTQLNLSGNAISDITPLNTLNNLTELNLSNNLLRDITPLSTNTQAQYQFIDLSYNYLDLTVTSQVFTDLQVLLNEEVELIYNPQKLEVISSDPVANASNIPINKVITVSFNDAVQAGIAYNSVNLATSNSSSVAVSCSIAGKMLRLTPTNSLDYQTIYTVTIPAGAVGTDAYNLLAEEYSFNFTTENTPSDNTTDENQTGGGGGGAITSQLETSNPSEIDLSEYAKFEKAQEDGQSVLNITLDSLKAFDKIKQGKGASIVIAVTQNAGVTNTTLTNEVLSAILEHNNSIQVKTPGGSYLLPSGELKVAELAQQLGVSAANLAIKITIAEIKPDQAAKITAEALAKGYGELAIPLEFTVTAYAGDEQAEISSFGSYVSREIILKQGVNQNHAVGVVVNLDGSFAPVPTQFRIEDGKTIAILKRKTNSTYTVIQNNKSFADVDNHWAKTEINSLASKLIIQGSGENTFNPEGKVTRAQIAVMIVRGLGLAPNASKAKFTDITAEQWYAGAVGAAVEAGIFRGYPDGTFQPNRAVTRQEVAAIILQALKTAGIQDALTESEKATYLVGFKDTEKIDTWAKTAVALCVKAGVIRGDDKHQFAPQANCSRAEYAVMLKKMLAKAALADE